MEHTYYAAAWNGTHMVCSCMEWNTHVMQLHGMNTHGMQLHGMEHTCYAAAWNGTHMLCSCMEWNTHVMQLHGMVLCSCMEWMSAAWNRDAWLHGKASRIGICSLHRMEHVRF